MKIWLTAALAALWCGLALTPAAWGGAQAAKARNCGSIPNRGGVGGPGIVPGEKFYYRVKVVKGTTSCSTAKSVISSFSMGGRSPSGWKCTNTNPTKCTSGKNEVTGKFYGVKPKKKKG